MPQTKIRPFRRAVFNFKLNICDMITILALLTLFSPIIIKRFDAAAHLKKHVRWVFVKRDQRKRER